MAELVVEEEHLKGLKIMIVDDMGSMRFFIRVCLEMVFPSCVCEEAKNGAAAMQFLQSREFNLILCDWELPGVKGDEILRWIREESQTKDTPFIMITGYNQMSYIQKAISLGVTDYVIKPINCAVLEHKIRRVLNPIMTVDPAQ